MNQSELVASKLRKDTGFDPGEPPIATLSRAMVDPATGRIVAYVDRTGTLVNANGLPLIPAMGAATSSVAGTAGLVPAPAAGDQTKFLWGDATWVATTGGTTLWSAVKTDAASISASSYTTVTGLSVTVTTTYTNQPVIIHLSTFVSCTSPDRIVFGAIHRDGTMINQPDSPLSVRHPAHWWVWTTSDPTPDIGWPMGGTLVDTASGSAGSHTYDFRVLADGRGGDVTINKTGTDADNAAFGVRTSSCISAQLGA